MFALINLNSQLVYAPDFIEIFVPIEYDNNSSQFPMSKPLFCCNTNGIFMNIKWLPFFYTHCIFGIIIDMYLILDSASIVRD